MTDDMHDDLSDKALSNLYREAAREEPSMKLDSAVLSEARKAVVKRKGWHLAGWLAPLATVAVAMLTVSLVIQMKQQHPETVAPATLEETAPAAKSIPANEKLMKEEKRQRETQDASKRKPAPSNLMENRASPDRMAGPKPPAAEVVEPKQGLTGRSTLMEQEKSKEADTMAPLADIPAEERIAPRSGKILYPENWIAKIRELLKQGEKEEARKEIEAFRIAYPDYELPDDLQLDRPR